jgi:hypothetical protein
MDDTNFNFDFQKIEFRKGTIGEEIQRMMLSRHAIDGEPNREAPVAPLLTQFVISFVHFVLLMITFGPGWDEMPTLEDVWQVLNGNDMLKYMALSNTLSHFLPILLDEQTGDSFHWAEAEQITEKYNAWVKKETAQL